MLVCHLHCFYHYSGKSEARLVIIRELIILLTDRTTRDICRLQGGYMTAELFLYDSAPPEEETDSLHARYGEEAVLRSSNSASSSVQRFDRSFRQALSARLCSCCETFDTI